MGNPNNGDTWYKQNASFSISKVEGGLSGRVILPNGQMRTNVIGKA